MPSPAGRFTVRLVYPDVLSSLRSRVPSRSDTYKVLIASSRPRAPAKPQARRASYRPAQQASSFFPGPSDTPSPPVRPAPALCAPRPGTRACADGCLPSGCTGAARRFSAGRIPKNVRIITAEYLQLARKLAVHRVLHGAHPARRTRSPPRYSSLFQQAVQAVTACHGAAHAAALLSAAQHIAARRSYNGRAPPPAAAPHPPPRPAGSRQGAPPARPRSPGRTPRPMPAISHLCAGPPSWAAPPSVLLRKAAHAAV